MRYFGRVSPHRDHIQTGLAATEAGMFAGLAEVTSSGPAVDSAYHEHDIRGMVYYHTRDPNYIADITSTWNEKIAAVRCYTTQFMPDDMETLLMSIGSYIPADSRKYRF